MKNILFLLLALPLFVFANDRPDYAVFLIDSSLTKDANAVIRSYNSIFDVESLGEATHRVKMVVTRLNKNANYEDVQVYYDQYSKVNYLHATIYDAFGNEVRKVKKNEIMDLSAVSGGSMYEDNRLKYIDLGYGQYPYTIEYEYEKQTESIMSYPWWFTQNLRTSVEISTYTLMLPKNINVQSRFFNLEEAIYKENKTEEGKHQSWQIKDVRAISYESGTPEPYKQLAIGLFIPNEFVAGGYIGDMSSWESFGKFVYGLNKDRDKLSEEMSLKVKELITGLTTEKEKIAVLYRYLQENMRYVSVQLGIGGWQTFDAKYVEENKFGDCKALSNFMKAMLKEAGIPSYHTLIYAGGDIPFHITEDFSYPRFNHMILHVPSTETWLECTSNLDPPNYLGEFTSDRNVLLITEEGGKLARTPTIDKSVNWNKGKTTILIDSKGAAKIKGKTILSGSFQEGYRYAKYKYSQTDLEKEFLKDSDLPMSDLQNLEVKVSKDVPQAIISYDLNVARYASKGGKRLFIPINSIGTFDNLPPKVKKERKHPYEVKYGYVEQDTIVFELPNQARVESMPKNANLTSDYGSFQLEYQMEGQKLICIRRLEVNALEVPAAEYESYRDFFKKVIKQDKAKLVVVISQA